MVAPFTIDGATDQAPYQHVGRTVELDGQPYGGWSEMTGGGVNREGMTYYYGAGSQPRGLSDGRVAPEEISLKLEGYTWQTLKNALIVKALSRGDSSDDGWMVVPWILVDQWSSNDFTRPSITKTWTVKIQKEAPETPASGEEFYCVLTLKPTGIPKETFGL